MIVVSVLRANLGVKTHHYYKQDESIAKYPNQNNRVGECDNEEWRDPCSVCSDEFINMGQHWSSTQCEYPELSDKQEDMLRGMLMSDGTVQFGENNNLKITLTEEKFLEWYFDKLDCICPNRYPTVCQTPEESKQGTIKSLGKENVDMDSKYKTKYLLLTRSHPFLNEFDNCKLMNKRGILLMNWNLHCNKTKAHQFTGGMSPNHVTK